GGGDAPVPPAGRAVGGGDLSPLWRTSRTAAPRRPAPVQTNDGSRRSRDDPGSAHLLRLMPAPGAVCVRTRVIEAFLSHGLLLRPGPRLLPAPRPLFLAGRHTTRNRLKGREQAFPVWNRAGRAGSLPMDCPGAATP